MSRLENTGTFFSDHMMRTIPENVATHYVDEVKLMKQREGSWMEIWTSAIQVR